jgi:hypothetical protein
LPLTCRRIEMWRNPLEKDFATEIRRQVAVRDCRAWPGARQRIRCSGKDAWLQLIFIPPQDDRNALRLLNSQRLNTFRPRRQYGWSSEKAQQIANHESARTTKLFDRRDDKLSLDEVERITT